MLRQEIKKVQFDGCGFGRFGLQSFHSLSLFNGLWFKRLNKNNAPILGMHFLYEVNCFAHALSG